MFFQTLVGLPLLVWGFGVAWTPRIFFTFFGNFLCLGRGSLPFLPHQVYGRAFLAAARDPFCLFPDPVISSYRLGDPGAPHPIFWFPNVQEKVFCASFCSATFGRD